MSGGDRDEPCVGIDFGTTTSLVACARPGDGPGGVRVELLPFDRDVDEADPVRLPTAVYVPRQDRLVLGLPAREQAVLRPDRVVRRLKPVLGRVDRLTVAGRARDPAELAAAILRRLRRSAETSLGTRVRQACVSVPASFGVRRRRVLLGALEAAGFRITPRTLIDEPVAALTAHLQERAGSGAPPGVLEGPGPHTVLLLDVGGGTSDACVARIRRDGPVRIQETLALSGYTPVGGDDFDARVAALLLEEFAARTGFDPAQIPDTDRRRLEWRLVAAAERVKRRLADPAGEGWAEIRQLFLHGVHHLVERIDRERYAALVAPLLADGRGEQTSDRPASVLDAAWEALRRAGLRPEELDGVLLAGGMALVPAVREAVGTAFGREPEVVARPLDAIAVGAAWSAWAHRHGLPSLRPARPVAAESVGVRVAGGAFRRLIGAGTPLPARVTEPRLFVVPDGGARYLRIPVGTGEGETLAAERILFTLAVRLPSRLAAGSPVVVELAVDENQTLRGAAWAEAAPEVRAEGELPPVRVEPTSAEPEEAA